MMSKLPHVSRMQHIGISVLSPLKNPVLFHKTFTSIREIIAINIPSAKRNDFVDCSHDRLVATQGSKGLHRGPSPSTKTPPGGPKRGSIRRGSGFQGLLCGNQPGHESTAPAERARWSPLPGGVLVHGLGPLWRPLSLGSQPDGHGSSDLSDAGECLVKKNGAFQQS